VICDESKFNVATLVFENAKSTLLVWWRHRTVQIAVHVQPEIKMADVKPAILIPEISEHIYLKFCRYPPHICGFRQHFGVIVWVLSDVSATDQSMIAVCNRKWTYNDVHLSLYNYMIWKSNRYPYFWGSGIITGQVQIPSDVRVSVILKMADGNRRWIWNNVGPYINSNKCYRMQRIPAACSKF